MTEIDQLERAKLAEKHGLRVQCQWENVVPVDQWYSVSDIDSMLSNSARPVNLRVHPDDEAKLDAIIWGSSPTECKNAYVSQSGTICFISGDREPQTYWKLIATREQPAENQDLDDSSVTITREEAQLFADLKELASDAVSGLKYIEQQHGRLYGVGWDRVYKNAESIFQELQEKQA